MKIISCPWIFLWDSPLSPPQKNKKTPDISMGISACFPSNSFPPHLCCIISSSIPLRMASRTRRSSAKSCSRRCMHSWRRCSSASCCELVSAWRPGTRWDPLGSRRLAVEKTWKESPQNRMDRTVIYYDLLFIHLVRNLNITF